MPDKVFCSEGADAFYFGYEKTDCPYPEGSRSSLLWLDGWDEARHDAERKQELGPGLRLPVPMFGVPPKSFPRVR